jgi:NAD(P)-dependent dehydrogenase (short-subunit alcohol dehydrogenase family)
MLEQGSPGAMINTGSKQGITNPPGVPAYGTAKAAVKTMTEQLAHGLREEKTQVTAHLLVPGWTFTGMSNAPDGQQPKGGWLPEQVVERMINSVDDGDFYIICPDDAVSPELDAARIQWSAGDIIENRPALSRWDAAWTERFEAFIKGNNS